MAKNAIARRGKFARAASAAASRANRYRMEVQETRKKYAARVRELKRREMPNAAMSAGAAGLAGGTIGLVKGATGFDELAGVPLEAVAAIGLAAGGWASKTPWMLQASGGPLAIWMHEMGQEAGAKISDQFGGK